MDDSQLTGSTSSYARKYSANGLFAIDDNVDANTTNSTSEPELTDKQIKDKLELTTSVRDMAYLFNKLTASVFFNTASATRSAFSLLKHKGGFVLITLLCGPSVLTKICLFLNSFLM